MFLLACWSLFAYERECVDMLIYFKLNLNLIQYVMFFALEQAVNVTLSLMNGNILSVRRLLSGDSTQNSCNVICVILSCNLIAFIV